MKYENSRTISITFSEQLIRDYFSADPVTREKTRRYVEEIIHTRLLDSYLILTMDDGIIYRRTE